ncbi:MAG: nucleotidyltransferase family protein [Clostridia bacterium]|nr:nucleotidyltransferase family protein [Clostridia bacterium]
MPRILGVIAEYNPFHTGHAYQLQRAREICQADYVVVAMSTCFTQRGEAAILPPAVRAGMALHDGADAVFALPAVWAVRDAEHFALGGAAILDGLGCDAISFGTEHTDLALLHAAAGLLEGEDTRLKAALTPRIASGMPYPAALCAAAEELIPGCGAILSDPNSTLAVCYLRALLRLGSSMEVVPVQRRSSYHATALGEALPSATALRGAILRGDWARVRPAMPGQAFRLLREASADGQLHRPDSLDTALLYRLRTMSPDDYAALPDLSEGIEHRLQAATQTARTREELLQTAKTRRYPYARLSRLAAHALLGFTGSMLASQDKPPVAWLLGFRSDAAPLLQHLTAVSRLPILSRSADHDRSAPWFAAEQRAQDIWSLGAGLPTGLALSQRMTIV